MAVNAINLSRTVPAMYILEYIGYAVEVRIKQQISVDILCI
jgi:hypothetical protein